MPWLDATDEELLRSADPDAFGAFYRRHVRWLLAYFARATPDAQLAADLTAETFAAALAGRRGHRAQEDGSAAAWLEDLGRRRLARAHRRGAAPDAARRRLA